MVFHDKWHFQMWRNFSSNFEPKINISMSLNDIKMGNEVFFNVMITLSNVFKRPPTFWSHEKTGITEGFLNFVTQKMTQSSKKTLDEKRSRPSKELAYQLPQKFRKDLKNDQLYSIRESADNYVCTVMRGIYLDINYFIILISPWWSVFQ